MKRFAPDHETISLGVVTPERGGWRIDVTESRTVRLFEVEVSDLEDCVLLYQAKVMTENLGDGTAYLEMLCHLPGQPDAFSRLGEINPLTGTTNWVSCETPMLLEKGEAPDVVRLNVVITGKGSVWVKDVVLRTVPTYSVPFFGRTQPR